MASSVYTCVTSYRLAHTHTHTRSQCVRALRLVSVTLARARQSPQVSARRLCGLGSRVRRRRRRTSGGDSQQAPLEAPSLTVDSLPAFSYSRKCAPVSDASQEPNLGPLKQSHLRLTVHLSHIKSQMRFPFPLIETLICTNKIILSGCDHVCAHGKC